MTLEDRSARLIAAAALCIGCMLPTSPLASERGGWDPPGDQAVATDAERLAGITGRDGFTTRGGALDGASGGGNANSTTGSVGQGRGQGLGAGAADTFIAGPGLTMHRPSGRLVDTRGEMVAEIGPDWTHAQIDAVSLKYNLLEAMGARADGRVTVRTANGQRRFVEGEVLTAVFESARRGSAVVMALDAVGRIYKLRTPITVSPGWRTDISLKVSPTFGEDHLILVVGHSVALLSQTLEPMQGQMLDATKVVEVLSALGDGSVATLPVLTSAR
ncbi:MAG: hypothetical protein AAF577_17625 [Pseudomonadota bacterium]